MENFKEWKPTKKYKEKKNTLGYYIKAKRKYLRITQKELSDKTGISNATIHNIEFNLHKPYKYTIDKLREALDIKAEEINELRRKTYKNKKNVTCSNKK